jgi:hypothetical protein
LSDSSGSDDENAPTTSRKVVEKTKKTPARIESINKASGSKMVDLKSIHDNLQQMETAKAKLINYKSSNHSERTSSDN